MHYGLLIGGVLLAYLLGSIPTSVWVGKILYKTDVRDHGSGNAGATNTIRVLGPKAGIPVLLFDAFKGWLAVFIAPVFAQGSNLDFTVNYQIITAAAVVLGHIFPVFAGFRGGKGVATLLGVGIALYNPEVWLILGWFILIFLSTRYVSLGSITGAILFPVVVWIAPFGGNPVLTLKILAVAVAVFIPLTHRKNIQRLLQGKESRFHLRKKI